MTQKQPTVCPFEHIKDPGLEAGKVTEIADRTISLLDNRYRYWARSIQKPLLMYNSEHDIRPNR